MSARYHSICIQNNVTAMIPERDIMIFVTYSCYMNKRDYPGKIRNSERVMNIGYNGLQKVSPGNNSRRVFNLQWLHPPFATISEESTAQEIFSTETEMSSFWWNLHHWLHLKLSKWRYPVRTMMKISSKRYFRFGAIPCSFSVAAKHHPLWKVR